MKKWMLLLLPALFAIPSFGQGGVYNSMALMRDSSGRIISVPFGQVHVCQFASPPIPFPCQNDAAIFGDRALTKVQANPFITDSNGNFGFFTAPGFYICQISGPNGSAVGSFTYPCLVPQDPTFPFTAGSLIPCPAIFGTATNNYFSLDCAGTLNLLGDLVNGGSLLFTDRSPGGHTVAQGQGPLIGSGNFGAYDVTLGKFLWKFSNATNSLDLPETVNLKANALVKEFAICPTGVTVGLLAKLSTNAGVQCVTTLANTDTTGIEGVVWAVSGSTALVAWGGFASCIADNNVAVNDVLMPGTSTGGRCKSNGANYPSGGQWTVGRATAAVSAGATFLMDIYSPGAGGSGGGGSGAPVNAAYVLMAANGSLPNARVLASSTSVTVNDNGAGNTAQSTISPPTVEAFHGNCSGAATANAVAFFDNFGQAGQRTCAGAVVVPNHYQSTTVASAGTVRNLVCNSGTTASSASNTVITIMINGVASTLVCNLNSTHQSNTDVVHTASVAANDRISSRMVTPAGEAALADVTFSLERSVP